MITVCIRDLISFVDWIDDSEFKEQACQFAIECQEYGEPKHRLRAIERYRKTLTPTERHLFDQILWRYNIIHSYIHGTPTSDQHEKRLARWKNRSNKAPPRSQT